MNKFRDPVSGKPVACILLALAAIVIGCHAADAQALSQKDVQIIAKAIGFLEPAPSGTATVAIVYTDAASKQAATTIAGYFGGGLQAGGATLKSRVVTPADLAAGGFLAIIAPDGAIAGQVSAAAKAQHALCVTADEAAVQSGACAMAVKTTPSVEIIVNKAAAAAAGVGFGSAFLLMAHQI
jgi:hypothetical protein